MLKVEALTAILSTGEKILTDISFSLPKGAKMAIIGPNGAGKSTLLKALISAIPADYRTLKVNGCHFEQLSLRERALQMSYIAQQQQVDEEITAWEWCELSRYPHYLAGKARGIDDQIIKSSLLRCDALQFAGRKLSTLSGGERQRVYMAGALAQETPLILLDEVGAALDPKHRETINQLIALEPEKTILSITHDLNMLDAYSHLLALKAGRVLAFGLREEVLSKSLLHSLFDYAFEEVVYQEKRRYF
ncbi:ABC transporter ATP-binding protein [Ignatzschineria indica]|uniref:ABC transporter ATP-binding protein n=1 Tax=Ignatzschineria indica TaxID=472583 RepID=UPI0025758D45|nr:ABC transporter ATP-binding protein [Ignatzschineria indica]MDM1545072.1 ABC transporter ATP-binding protein [Ignatzschineria indica]